MNMSHVITHLSFGKKVSPSVMSNVKRIIPYLGASHDRLSGRSYINQDEASNANVTVSFWSSLFVLSVCNFDFLAAPGMHVDI